MYQLTKLPVLFEHYHAHKAADKTLTMWGFFAEHYLQNDPSDPDYKADMQLPFKSHNECVACSITAMRCVEQKHYDWLLLRTLEISDKEYQLYKQPNLLSALLTAVWQPPKTA